MVLFFISLNCPTVATVAKTPPHGTFSDEMSLSEKPFSFLTISRFGVSVPPLSTPTIDVFTSS